MSSVGLATALAGPGLVWAEEEAIEEVEEVVVTGSRIQRTENTQSRPVVTITGADLIASGAISVADALRDSALNSLGSFRDLQAALPSQMRMLACAVLELLELSSC